MKKPPRRIPTEAEIIDSCSPPLDAVKAWPYGGSDSDTTLATQIALVLRRFRDPVVTIGAVLWALRMQVYSQWHQGNITQTQLGVWNDFFNMVDTEQPIPTPVGGYHRWLRDAMGQIGMVTFYGIAAFLARRIEGFEGPSSPSRNPMWVFLRGYQRLLDDRYPVFDEADYYVLGQGVEWLFATSAYRPLVLDTTTSLKNYLAVFRWWEVLQCVMPIRDIFGPPLRLDEIRASADEEFLWDDQVIQALAWLLEDHFQQYLANIRRRNVGDYPQAGEYWHAWNWESLPIVASIEMRAPLTIVDPIPDMISIKAEMAEELAGSYHFFLDRELDFNTSDTVESVAAVLNETFAGALQ